MRIGVHELHLGHQRAARLQQRDDLGIGLPHRLAGEVLHLGHEAAVVVDRVVDRQAVALAEIVVLLAVPGGDVHEARSGVHRHEHRRVHRAEPVDPRVSVLEPLDLEGLERSC